MKGTDSELIFSVSYPFNTVYHRITIDVAISLRNLSAQPFQLVYGYTGVAEMTQILGPKKSSKEIICSRFLLVDFFYIPLSNTSSVT